MPRVDARRVAEPEGRGPKWRRGVLVFWFILAAQFIWRSVWGFATEGFSWFYVAFAVIAVVSGVVGLRFARRYRANPFR
jgi:membrane protein implicated in regulation of membrane protease activity